MIVGLYVKKPAIGKQKAIVPLKKKVGLLAVFFDAKITAVSRAQTYVCGELWSPTTDLRGCYQIKLISVVGGDIGRTEQQYSRMRFLIVWHTDIGGFVLDTLVLQGGIQPFVGGCQV